MEKLKTKVKSEFTNPSNGKRRRYRKRRRYNRPAPKVEADDDSSESEFSPSEEDANENENEVPDQEADRRVMASREAALLERLTTREGEPFIANDADSSKPDDTFGYYSEGSEKSVWTETDEEDMVDPDEDLRHDFNITRENFVSRSRVASLEKEALRESFNGSATSTTTRTTRTETTTTTTTIDPLQLGLNEIQARVTQRERAAAAADRRREAGKKRKKKDDTAPLPTVPEPWPEEPDLTPEELEAKVPACVICLSRAKCVLVMPCGHKIMCVGCSQRFSEQYKANATCPSCRKEVTALVRVYE